MSLTGPCNLASFTVERTEGNYTTWWLGFAPEIAGRKSFHALSVPTSARNPECPAHLFLRMVCHVLADQIPDEGLPELCETAKDILEFYTQRELKADSWALPGERSPIASTVVGTFERPAFSIQEE